MENDNYLIEYESIKHLSIKEFLQHLESVKGKNLNELKVSDLSYHNLTPIWPGEGVYLFRNNKNITYVGKVSSMSFTERIPKHFDIRHFAWFNRLLELICVMELKHKWNNAGAKKASKYAFENLNLILINFSNRQRINRTERLIRSCSGALNRFKSLQENNLNKTIDNY